MVVKKLNTNAKKLLASLYSNRRCSATELAESFSITTPTLYCVLREYGVQPYSKRADAEEQKIVKDYIDIRRGKLKWLIKNVR